MRAALLPLLLCAACAAGGQRAPRGYPFDDEVHSSGVLTHREVLEGLAFHVEEVARCIGSPGHFIARADFVIVDGLPADIRAGGFPVEASNACLAALIADSAFARRQGATEVKWILEFGVWAGRPGISPADPSLRLTTAAERARL